MKTDPKVLAERRACMKIARDYYRNEVAWRNAYERKGPKEMWHNAQGGTNAAWEIWRAIEERGKRKKKP